MRGPSLAAGSADFIGRRMAFFSSCCCNESLGARASAWERLVETANKSTRSRRSNRGNSRKRAQIVQNPLILPRLRNKGGRIVGPAGDMAIKGERLPGDGFRIEMTEHPVAAARADGRAHRLRHRE